MRKVVTCHTDGFMDGGSGVQFCTAGKEYEITKQWSDGSIEIIDDVGRHHGFGPSTYVEWFERIDQFDFGTAIRELKDGKRVARQGWNGKGMWLKLVEMDHYDIISQKVGFNPVPSEDPTGWNLLPWIGMKTADNKFVPWLASQTDMLSEDWTIAND